MDSNELNIFNKRIEIPEGGVPTLQNITKRKLLVYYWDDAGVFTAVDDESWKFYGQMCNLPETDSFGEMCSEIEKKLKTLVLPISILNELLSLFKPIGLQICESLDVVRNFEGFDKDKFMNSLVFNHAHFIVISKSIDLWIQNIENDSTRIALFNKACYFCLESRINSIWNDMSDERNNFNTEFETAEGLFLSYWIQRLEQQTWRFMINLRLYGVRHWNHWLLQDVIYHERNINWLMLKFSTLEGNYSAVAYFSQLLNGVENDGHILDCLRSARESEERNAIRAPQFAYINHCLYDQLILESKTFCLHSAQEFFINLLTDYWQYQERAPHVINMFWDDLTIRVYNNIVQKLIKKAVEGRYLQEHLIEKIWQMTPIDKKRRFFSFVISDFDSLKIFYETSLSISWRILSTATVTEKNAILSAFEI